MSEILKNGSKGHTKCSIKIWDNCSESDDNQLDTFPKVGPLHVQDELIELGDKVEIVTYILRVFRVI